MDWNPERYLDFADQRERPIQDLLNRVALDAPESITDLGCGPGNSTRHLARRWPQAKLTGVDQDRAMLEQAAAGDLAADWQEADIADWTAAQPQDLIFSNATLHWLDDHATLFPKLLGQLHPGGVLAVQMPANFHAPSHQHLVKLAASPPWNSLLDPQLLLQPIAEIEAYYQLLAGQVQWLDLWTTEYLHILEGDDPVLRWVEGTALLPVRHCLDDGEFAAFRGEYADCLRISYPKRPDGKTLFPFRRLFIVAVAAGG